MRSWSPLQVGLLVVAIVVFGVAAVLGVMALQREDRTCVVGRDDDAVAVDRSPEEALADFVANNDDLYPLEGWEVASTEEDRTVFTNDDDGEFEVVVESGAVTEFRRCD